MNHALDFISVGRGAPALSPLFDGALASGATFGTREGWEVPVSFGGAAVEAAARRDSVAWADASHLPKWELQGPAAALDAIASMPAAGERLAARAGNAWFCRVTPSRALVIGGEAPAAGPDVHVLDLRSQMAALRIAGPQAREAIARFCALDLRPKIAPPRSFRPGSVARTPGFVIAEGADSFLLLFGAAYGAYVWDVVSDAGTHLGGSPVGVDVLDGSDDTAPRAEEAASHA